MQERFKWFQEARYGLFIHWGAYSQAARGEWVMNRERIPLEEYRNDPDPRRRQEHAEELMIYGPLDQKRVKYDEQGKQVAS